MNKLVNKFCSSLKQSLPRVYLFILKNVGHDEQFFKRYTIRDLIFGASADALEVLKSFLFIEVNILEILFTP